MSPLAWNWQPRRISEARREHDDLRRRAKGLTAQFEQLRAQLGADADAPLRELESIERGAALIFGTRQND